MRDEDLLYKKKHNSPAHGAAAFADAVKIDAAHQAKILWAQNLQNHRAADRRLLTPHAIAVEIEVTMPETADKQSPNENFVTRQVTLRKCARRRRATIHREKLLSSMVADRHQWIFRAVILITARDNNDNTTKEKP